MSHAVMFGGVALAVAALYEMPTRPVAVVEAQPASVPEVRSRPVSTMRINVAPSVKLAQAVNAPKQPTTAVAPSSVTVVAPLPPSQPAPSTSTVEPRDLALWPETEIAAALRACTTLLADHTLQFEAQPPVRQGSCGAAAPIKVSSVGRAAVSLQPPSVMNCAVAAAVSRWVERVLQPAAQELLASPVVRMLGTGSYTCRNRNGAADGPISEHAFANAFDVAGFVLADGRTINVLGGWGRVARDTASGGTAVIAQAADKSSKVATTAKPSLAPDRRSALQGPPVIAAAGPDAATPEAATPQSLFLRRIHAEACAMFGTVLGPEANDAHRNHLHFDLKERKGSSYCQ